tara:strand:- start:971 stop:1114 length:144 start_codon:yes stop_codon:yes gene_type:complete
MISALILFYFTIFVSFQMGMRIALTRIDTKIFLIMILTIWILIKNIT